MIGLVALGLAVLAGEPQCPNDMNVCSYGVGDGTFWKARNRVNTDSFPYSRIGITQRMRLCSADSWATSEQCHERCNFRLEITQPADLRMTVCLVDNDYTPYVPDSHIDLYHPLNGVEHDIVNISASMGSCGSNGSPDLTGKIAFHGETCDATAAGGAALALHTSGMKNNAVGRASALIAPSSIVLPSAAMPRHHSLLLWEALERGAAVRGKVVFSCDELPQISGTTEDFGDGCPFPRMAGMCNDAPLPQDRLCSRCPLELRVAGVSVCLWGNTLLPRKRETLLQNTVQLPLATAADEVVVASDLPDKGCSASDYAQLSGKIVVVKGSWSCLPFTQVRMAQSQGVRAFIMAPTSLSTFLTVVEGPSLGVTIPVHAVDHWNYTTLLEVGKSQPAGVKAVKDIGTFFGPGEMAPGSASPLVPPPTVEEQKEEMVHLVPDSLSTWEWNALVTVCAVLIVLEVILLAVLFVHQHRHAVDLPADKGSSGVSMPLGVASMGLSLSLLLIIAIVAFALAHTAGQESTNTALDDGRAATQATHDNAANNVEELARRMRLLIIDRALESLSSVMARFESSATTHSIVARDFDGSWSSFNASYPKLQVLNRALTGTMTVHLLTTNGFYGDQNIITDFRNETERGDGVAGDVVTNNTGFPYGMVHSYDAYPPTYFTAYSAAVFNATNVLGSSRRSPLDVFNKDESGLSRQRYWHVARRAVDVFPITAQYTISMVMPFINKDGQYWGTLEATDVLSVVGVIVSGAISGDGLQNMTVMLVDYEDGAVIADSTGENVNEVGLFKFTSVWGSVDYKSIRVLHTVHTMPSVHVKSLGNYLDKQQNGWVEHNGEFDQRDEWSAQHLYLAKLRVAGGVAVDESGEDVKAESRGGGCGSCTVMDTDLGREVFAFDGTNVLHIYNNLTVGATDVAKTRTSPVGQAWASNEPEYAESIVMSDGTECVARRPPGGGDLSCYILSSFTHRKRYTISVRVRPDDVAVNRQVRGAQLFSQTFAGETNVRVFADGELSVNVLSRGCRVMGVSGGLPVNKWSTVTAVVSSTACDVYVDGRLHATDTYTDELDINHQQEHAYYAGRHFQGRMDNLMMFGETLTAAEVMSLHTVAELVRDVPSRRWFVAAKTLKQVTGLRGAMWSAAVMVPREDIMRQVDENNRVTMSNLAVQEDNTSKKLERKTNETVMVIVVIAIFSVCVFLIFNSMLTRPFARYAVLMTEASVMKVDDLPESESFIRELRAMNRAMRLMLRNLKEYKSYMPQTLQLDGQTTEDSESATEEACPVPSSGTGTGTDRRSSGQRSLGTIHSMSQGTDIRRQATVAGQKRQELMCTLTRKKFSLLVVNLKDWHNITARLSDKEVVTLHSGVLQKVLVLFNHNKGISEVFSGDRFVCTFNAAKQVGSHRLAACTAACLVAEKLEEDHELRVSSSVVSGEGRIGNMGTDLMKRFTCVSPVMTWGFALERFCRSLDLKVLADSYVYDDVWHHFKVMVLDAIDFPKRNTQPVKVAQLLGRRQRGTGENDEWMYEIEANERGDSFKRWNDCIFNILTGKYDTETLNEFLADGFINANSPIFKKLQKAVAEAHFSPSFVPFH